MREAGRVLSHPPREITTSACSETGLVVFRSGRERRVCMKLDTKGLESTYPLGEVTDLIAEVAPTYY